MIPDKFDVGQLLVNGLSLDLPAVSVQVTGEGRQSLRVQY